jgi:hypothetical protein
VLVQAIRLEVIVSLLYRFSSECTMIWQMKRKGEKSWTNSIKMFTGTKITKLTHPKLQAESAISTKTKLYRTAISRNKISKISITTTPSQTKTSFMSNSNTNDKPCCISSSRCMSQTCNTLPQVKCSTYNSTSSTRNHCSVARNLRCSRLNVSKVWLFGNSSNNNSKSRLRIRILITTNIKTELNHFSFCLSNFTLKPPI